MISVSTTALFEQAKSLASIKRNTVCQLNLTLITPNLHYEVPNVERLSRSSDFIKDGSDIWAISFLMQPGVFLKSILPHKDNLLVDLVETVGTKRTLRRLRATVPLDQNTAILSNRTVDVNPTALDQNMVVTVTLILLDTTYEQLRNQPLLNNYLMGNPKDVLHNVWTEEGKRLGSNGVNKFKGVDIEEPVDNDRIYRQIMVKHGTRLTRFAEYLQNEEGLGIYTRGCGSFYRDGLWYVFPLCKPERYGTVKKSLDIYKFPQDILPVADQTYAVTDRSVLIISTGPGEHVDGTDNLRQNFGAGQQILSASAVGGEEGTFYQNGTSITLRKTKVSEYRTTQRASGQELININQTPTNNICKEISANTMRDCSVLKLSWANGDPDLLYPGAPLRYYYLGSDDSLVVQEGTLIEVQTEYYPNSTTPLTPFKKNCTLTLLLLPIQNTTVTPNN